MPRRAQFLGLALDIGLSPAVYYAARLFGLDDLTCLALGTAAVAARAGWVWLRRDLDLLLALVLLTNTISLAAALWVGDARLVLLRDPLTSSLVGLVFLASCLVRRPALYYLSRRMRPGTAEEARRLAEAGFRRPFAVVTSVWAAALLAEAVLRGVLVFELPVSVMAGVSQLVEIVVLVPVVVWTVWFRRRARAAVAAAG